MKSKHLLFTVLVMIVNFQSSFGQLKSGDLQKIVERTRLKFGLPSVAIVTMNSDSILHSEIQGVKIHGQNNNASSNNYFHIGSCSKSILAVIAAKLVEQNKIKWSSPFFEIFPDLKDSALSTYQHITLEELFLCRAGIREFTTPLDTFPVLNPESKNPRVDFAQWLVQQKPKSRFIDGKFEFLYSNAGYTMASLMLERVSEKSYEELIKDYLIDEMGIATFIGFPNRLDSEQPWGHTITKNGIEIFSPEHDYQIPELIIPAGDLSMQPEGFAKYIQLSLKGLIGKDNFIKSSSYKCIHYSHKGFSIGVFNSKMFGYEFSGMDGSAGTFFCRAILIPESDFAFTIMTNAGSGTGEMKAVDRMTMKILKKQFNWWWKFWM